MVVTTYLIINLSEIIAKKSIVIYIDDNQISVTDLIFPAVTICPTLIFNTIDTKTIDYTAIVAALENNEIDIRNFSMKE